MVAMLILERVKSSSVAAVGEAPNVASDGTSCAARTRILRPATLFNTDGSMVATVDQVRLSFGTLFSPNREIEQTF
jgi:hypothetical protein